MLKTVDCWISYLRCNNRIVQLKNGRPTNGVAISKQCDYSIFTLLDFHPSFNFHHFQLPIWLHCGFAVSKLYTPTKPLFR